MRPRKNKTAYESYRVECEAVGRAAELLMCLGFKPRVVGCVGALSDKYAVVGSLSVETSTGEVDVGRTVMSCATYKYGIRYCNRRKESILRSIYSTALRELEPMIGKDRVLILPALYERNLKEITP